MVAADGASVIFTRMKDANGEWYRRAADLAGEDELLFRAPGSGVASSISPNGRFVLFTGPLPGPADIQVVDISRVAEAREAIPLVTSDFNEANARFSPNGRWFAYASNESGTYEIYVRPFNPDAAPGAPLSVGGRVMVSKGGANAVGAIWRADGKELFYLAPDRSLMSVAVETEPTFRVSGSPQPLFKRRADLVAVLRRLARRPALLDARSVTAPARRSAVQSRAELDLDAEVTTRATRQIATRQPTLRR